MSDDGRHVDDEDTHRWDATTLRDEALDCISGQHTALYADDRANELLRAVGLALLATYEQRREFYAVLLDAVRSVRAEP